MSNRSLGLEDPLYRYMLDCSLREDPLLAELRAETARMPHSALAVMQAMPRQGEATCLDISEEWTKIAQRYWIRAGLAERIHLHLRPAAETLESLIRDGWSGDYDMAFIDADKTGYIDYYESCMTLLRPGGLVLIDNTLWDGEVVRPVEEQDEDTRAIHAFNRHVHDDDRVDLSLVPIGDGLTIARKRA